MGLIWKLEYIFNLYMTNEKNIHMNTNVYILFYIF